MMDTATMAAITNDVLHEISPEDSILDYTDEMLTFRASLERDLEENPHAQVEIPFDWPELDDDQMEEIIQARIAREKLYAEKRARGEID